MNLDEVMALTDEQLRIKAWEALGWRHVEIIDGVKYWRRYAGTAFSTQLKDIPDYPNDSATAWGLFVAIPRQRIIEWEKDGTGHIDCRDCPSVFFEKDEEPRAATRVFILAMEASKEPDGP